MSLQRDGTPDELDQAEAAPMRGVQLLAVELHLNLASARGRKRPPWFAYSDGICSPFSQFVEYLEHRGVQHPSRRELGLRLGVLACDCCDRQGG